MKEPQRIKLTDSPEPKKVKLTPLPSIKDNYPDRMSDDIYIKPSGNYENNQQNNSESIQQLEPDQTN